MKIYYDSQTGNVKKFISHLPFRAEQIEEHTIATEPFILITYTTLFGVVPSKTENFLQKNQHFLMGVAVSGNRNWGSLFGKAGDTISETYHVPLLHKFELFGEPRDREVVVEKVEEMMYVAKAY